MASISPSPLGGVAPLAESFAVLYRRMAGSFTVPALLLAASLWTMPPALEADATPATSTTSTVRPVPPPGVAISDGDRAELKGKIEALGEEIESLGNELKNKPAMLELLPDVQIFYKAADWAVRYNEFFNPKEVATAKNLLEMGMARAKELRAGKPSWNTATGLVPRGYISRIDGSVQPYGMVIPDDWKADETAPRRLDFWCHGRGETLSELSFINQRLTSKGEYTPPGALVLHLYGRYCCANKFAGELDLFEALDNAKKHYKIDPNKLVVRGFSMGGASVWQFATHFASTWAAANPGAGFGDTKEFMKLGATPDRPLPPAWEQTLWKWYDSKDYVSNLADTTTVAYSGEKDGQKEAADLMIRSAREEAGVVNPPMGELGKVAPGDGSPKAAEARVTGTAPGVVLYHVIGPDVQHKIKPEAKPEVESLVDQAVSAETRNKYGSALPKGHWTTYTLIYPGPSIYLAINPYITGMEKEWERADLDWDATDPQAIRMNTKNVTGFVWNPTNKGKITIDGQAVDIVGPTEDLSGHAFVKVENKWQVANGSAVTVRDDKTVRKKPGRCGPIDHAFMSSFVFVHPTGKPLNEKVDHWTKEEFEHATSFWRKVFRGDAPVKDDTAITERDIAHSNLVLWGDPSSNAMLAKILPKLPIQWTQDSLVFAGESYDATHVAPVMIFPNPLNPKRYVVINSGPTMREQALLNNADQTPKLPDWAMVDLDTPPDGKWPGKILSAGFFDENWAAPKK